MQAGADPRVCLAKHFVYIVYTNCIYSKKWETSLFHWILVCLAKLAQVCPFFPTAQVPNRSPSPLWLARLTSHGLTNHPDPWSVNITNCFPIPNPRRSTVAGGGGMRRGGGRSSAAAARSKRGCAAGRPRSSRAEVSWAWLLEQSTISIRYLDLWPTSLRIESQESIHFWFL